MTLRVEGEWFIDEHGRRVLLRGVNLGGSSKVPTRPDGATHLSTDYSDHRDVSFVGRPFPLKEADEHLGRLKHWGFNALRLIATWEAIEHRGPGLYDSEFLDYLDELSKIIDSHKLYTFIDPHQDVWSRMSGGDGAPGWTFETAGLDITKFATTGAASLMHNDYDPDDPQSYPHLSWHANSARFASAMMWTLFLGGRTFAPSCIVDGMNIQDYLQKHFIGSYKKVAERLRDAEYIIGFDTVNEPEAGWINKKVDGSNQEFEGLIGLSFTPFDAMTTASGFSREVSFQVMERFGLKVVGHKTVNESGEAVWLDGHDDIWQKEGVWGIDSDGMPTILNNDHFLTTNRNKLDFYNNHMSPFFDDYTEAIRSVNPDAIIFFEVPFFLLITGGGMNINPPPNSAHAPHWYDGMTLSTKKFRNRISYDIYRNKIVIGKKQIREMFLQQLLGLKNVLLDKGPLPTLIGEFGLPYDMKGGRSFGEHKVNPTKAWRDQTTALSLYYDLLDKTLLHSTQWNYTSDNNNQWGDLWNNEDLSIFSRDQQDDPSDINSGGRAIKGFCRPRFLHIAGVPLLQEFDPKKRSYILEYEVDPEASAPTEIYLPKIQYPEGYSIEVLGADTHQTVDEQVMQVVPSREGHIRVMITPKK
jgi:hypothetical protein